MENILNCAAWKPIRSEDIVSEYQDESYSTEDTDSISIGNIYRVCTSS